MHDHLVRLADEAVFLQDRVTGLLDAHLSNQSNRLNRVMKVLTIIATIFIPLSFFAGLYGMNFDYMPELGVRWAYPVLLVAMATVAGGMVWYFRITSYNVCYTKLLRSWYVTL